MRKPDKDIYFERFRELKKELGIKRKDFLADCIDPVLEKNKKEASSVTIKYWVNGGYRKHFPPAEILAAFAFKMNVSVDYLLGLHDIREIKNDTAEMTFDIEKLTDDYSLFNNGKSISANTDISYSWVYTNKNSKNQDALLRIDPIYKLASSLGYSIDYCLGLTPSKTWKHYCFANDLFQYLDQDTIFYLPQGNPLGERYALLTVPTDKDASFSAILNDGTTIPLSELKDSGAVLVSKCTIIDP